jgi:hypothetical protein
VALHVDRRVAPVTAPPPSVASARWAASWRRRRAADLITVLFALAAVVAALLTALSRRPPYTLEEAAAIAATVDGNPATGASIGDRVLVSLLRAFTDVTDAFDRASAAVQGGRAAMVVAAVVVAILVWVLGRQLTGSRGVAAVAVLLLASSPYFVGLQLVVDPVNIAAFWLTGAAIAAATGAGLRAAPLVAALLLPAVACAPFLVVAAPILVASAWGRRTSAPTGRTARIAGVALFGLWVVAAHAALADRAPDLWPQPLSMGAAPSWPEAVLVLLGSAGVVGALVDDRLRAFAATVLALVPAAAYAPDRLAVVAAPLSAVLTATVVVSIAEVGWHRSRSAAMRPARRTKTLVRRAAVVTSVAVVGAVGAAAWMRAPQPVNNGLIMAVDGAERWVTGNLAPGDARLVVDGAIWVDLSRAGYAREDLVLAGAEELPTAGPANPANPADPADQRRLIWVATPALGSPSAGLGGRLLAEFGTGSQHVAIVQQWEPDAPDDQEIAADATARADAATALGRNPNLVMSAEAERVLRAGDIDSRVLAVLATLAAEYHLDIASFPAVAGEEGLNVPRRCTRILRIGDRGGAEGAAATRELVSWLRAQGVPYRPLRTDIVSIGADAALDVCFSAPSPIGLLSGGTR